MLDCGHIMYILCCHHIALDFSEKVVCNCWVSYYGACLLLGSFSITICLEYANIFNIGTIPYHNNLSFFFFNESASQIVKDIIQPGQTEGRNLNDDPNNPAPNRLQIQNGSNAPQSTSSQSQDQDPDPDSDNWTFYRHNFLSSKIDFY